jgi:preprotein translocase subunit SecD
MLQFPPWKVILIVGITLIGALLALPNALTEKQRESIPGFLPSSPVNLGLDLQGGVYLLLEVDHQRSVIKQLEDLKRDAQTRLNATRGADRIYYSDMRVNPTGIEIKLPDQEEAEAAIEVLKPVTTSEDGSSKGVRVVRKGNGVIDIIFSESKLTAIKRDPSISFSKEFERTEAVIRKLIRDAEAAGTLRVQEISVTEPSFSFKPRDPQKLDAAKGIMREINKTVGGPLGASGLNINEGDNGEIVVSFSTQKAEEIKRDAVRQTVAKLGPRLDPNGLGELTIQPQGDSRIIIEAPGEKDPVRLKTLIQQPGELTLNIVDNNSTRIDQALRTGRTPDGFMIVPEATGGLLLVEEDPIITGDMVKSATQGFDQNGRPAVNFVLNTRGAAIFGRESGANIGRRFAIVLDGESKSAPVIRSAIVGGSGIIEGSFTMDEARDLATVIQAGALPADVVVEEERQVGASLGEDSIKAGATASLIGLALVAIFMIIAYGLFGGFAVGSLFVNILLILGALSGLGATLTLPGIAGIILTIGMAVDANVLVFERIREESRNGRSPLTAVDTGYQQALSTILDANITTLLAAAVLYTLGSGPVKGFAVTLAIGIFTSVFTAFVVTRWFTVMWLRGTRPKVLPL